MSTTPKSLRDLKVGDKVFVVSQRGRLGNRTETGEQMISKVGRKFLYLARYGRHAPFSRETGKSHHDDSNARTNGCGFDVYLSEQDYQREQFALAEFNRLKERIVRNYHGIINLPPDVVEKIHSVLDEAGINKTQTV